jgi:hypothetical protein
VFCLKFVQVLAVLTITQQVSFKYTHGTFTSTVEKFQSSLCNHTLPLVSLRFLNLFSPALCSIATPPHRFRSSCRCACCRPCDLAHCACSQSAECLCRTPMQFSKFVLFYCDG